MYQISFPKLTRELQVFLVKQGVPMNNNVSLVSKSSQLQKNLRKALKVELGCCLLDKLIEQLVADTSLQ